MRYLGRLDDDEYKSVRLLLNRKSALVELLQCVASKGSKDDLVIERIIDDTVSVNEALSSWWASVAELHSWKYNYMDHWTVNPETHEIYLQEASH